MPFNELSLLLVALLFQRDSCCFYPAFIWFASSSSSRTGSSRESLCFFGSTYLLVSSHVAHIATSVTFVRCKRKRLLIFTSDLTPISLANVRPLAKFPLVCSPASFLNLVPLTENVAAAARSSFCVLTHCRRELLPEFRIAREYEPAGNMLQR